MKKKLAPFVELGFAKPEPRRSRRQGFPEAIFCPGKTSEQVGRIFAELLKGGGPVIATRASPELGQTLQRQFTSATYHLSAGLVTAKPASKHGGRVLVLTGGTADFRVAEEAAVTLEVLGRRVTRLYDVGVAGLDRVLAHRSAIAGARVIIVCAGMDGALPSVVGGLAACPVIAVPTSIGYGAHLQGIAPLLTMLNSCAANVSVVNIDNGFSAAIIAALISK